MSSTNRNNPSEFYRTPAWVVDCLLPHIGSPRVVFDLGCGEGDIGVALAAKLPGVELYGVEKDASRASAARGRRLDLNPAPILYDVVEADLTVDVHGFRSNIPVHWYAYADLVIANPPFSLALDFARMAFRLVRPGGLVAILHRESWLSTIDRAAFARSNPCDKHVIPRRVSFQKSNRPCPVCEGEVQETRCKRCKGKGQLTSTNDSVPHAWHVWRPGVVGFGGRWSLLEVPETPV